MYSGSLTATISIYKTSAGITVEIIASASHLLGDFPIALR